MFSRHFFMYELIWLAIFFQFGHTINNSEVILAVREEKIEKTVCQMFFFFNVIYFGHLEILHSNFFFTVSNFLVNLLDNLFLTVKTIFNCHFQSIVPSTVQPFVYNFNFIRTKQDHEENWEKFWKILCNLSDDRFLAQIGLIALLPLQVCPPYLPTLACTLRVLTEYSRCKYTRDSL